MRRSCNLTLVRRYLFDALPQRRLMASSERRVLNQKKSAAISGFVSPMPCLKLAYLDGETEERTSLSANRNYHIGKF